MIIKEALLTDLETILEIEKIAFNREEEADLVKKLLNDDTAKPFLSLVAWIGDKAIGHVLFTKA